MSGRVAPITAVRAVRSVGALGRLPAMLLALALLGACATRAPEVRPEAEAPAPAPPAEPETGATEDSQRLKFEQGIAALAARDYRRASRIFSEIIGANPALSGPYANLALIEFKQGRTEQAYAQVNRALEINPANAQAWHLRAQIHLQQGEIKNARDDYLRAIEIDPEYLNAHYNLALLYDIYLQEIALAIEHYSIYLALSGQADESLREWINHLKGTLENG